MPNHTSDLTLYTHSWCKPPAPKLQWKWQLKMVEYWKHVVGKLTATGMVGLPLL